jgi:putative ABC transport system permease protein
LIIRSNVSLREVSLEIFDRTFAITGVLQLLVTGVAFVGVLSSLMALQLERQRELGILRATGMTPGQIWRLVTSQSGLMGIVAGVLAIPVGIMMAMVLIFVINQRSFGWTFPTLVEPSILLYNMLLAVFAALLAGLYPALKMSKVPPAVVLREE